MKRRQTGHRFRRKRALRSFALAALLAACPATARSSHLTAERAHDVAAKALRPPPDKACVYVIDTGAKRFQGWADLHLGSQDLGRVSPGIYVYALVDPGHHELHAAAQVYDTQGRNLLWVAVRMTRLILDLEAGETAYVELHNTRASRLNHEIFELHPRSPEEGAELLARARLSNLNNFGRDARGLPPAVGKDPRWCLEGGDVPSMLDPGTSTTRPVECRYDETYEEPPEAPQ